MFKIGSRLQGRRGEDLGHRRMRKPAQRLGRAEAPQGGLDASHWGRRGNRFKRRGFLSPAH
jgi:hypothetical protein